MLEDLALQFIDWSDEEVRALYYGLTIIGGIIGGVTNRSDHEISRAPYFVMSSMIVLFASIMIFGGMTFIVPALANGFFWTTIALEMIVSVVSGIFLARISIARSRDAYGHGRMAALGFIPFANLWLLFTPSKNTASINRAPNIPLLTGRMGVVTGFVVLISGLFLRGYTEIDGERRVDEAAAAGAFTEVMLDRILAVMAAEVQTPQTVDEVTTLLKIEAKGTDLFYVYELSSAQEFIPVSMRMGLLQQNCSNPDLSPLIKAGAEIMHVYLRQDGSEIGNVQVSGQNCGY